MNIILAVASVLLGLLMGYANLAFYHKHKNAYYAWIKLVLGLIGLYWAGIYIVVLLSNFGIIPPTDPIDFGRIFVRPAIVLWLGISSAAALFRLKCCK
jgi:hypothetical protein